MRWIPPRQRIQRPINSPPERVFRWITLVSVLLISFGVDIHHARSAPGSDPTTQTPRVTLRFVSWKPDHPRVWDEALAEFADPRAFTEKAILTLARARRFWVDRLEIEP